MAKAVRTPEEGSGRIGVIDEDSTPSTLLAGNLPIKAPLREDELSINLSYCSCS